MRAKVRMGGLLLAAALTSCSDNGTGPSPQDLAGTWNVTKLEFVSVANPAAKVDVIALGGSLVLVLRANHTYEATETLPGEAPETFSGTWEASTDVFTITQVGMSGNRQFQMSLAGNTLTLSGADAGFDFNGDDVDEAAKLNMVMVRN